MHEHPSRIEDVTPSQEATPDKFLVGAAGSSYIPIGTRKLFMAIHLFDEPPAAVLDLNANVHYLEDYRNDTAA